MHNTTEIRGRKNRASRAYLSRACSSQMPGLAKGMQAILLASLGMAGAHVGPALADDPRPVPLQHVASDDEDSGYDMLGIMIGINGVKPRLFMFDTGSDQFNAQIDSDTPDITPLPDSAPEMYGYGDGSYGNWVQKVRFNSLSYFDPEDPSDPVASFEGDYVAGRVLDLVYTKDYPDFENMNLTRDPVGNAQGTPVYANLDIRQRVQNGEPGEVPPFYGIYGAGDFVSEDRETSAPGQQTQSGYVISANANLDASQTPGCSPCLTLNLTPSLRSQFTALTPWGKLDYEDYQKQFSHSGANASSEEEEGSYNYTLSFEVDDENRSAEFQGPILFDTGTLEFISISQDKVLKGLKKEKFVLDENSSSEIDFGIHGFANNLDNLDFDDVEISRQQDEEEGSGITIGLPFFHENSVMYDLENRTTAYTPFFVTADDFTTDATSDSEIQLDRVTSDMGSEGWLGLAGTISGNGDFTIETDTTVRMTGANSYTGATHIAQGAFLFLAGPGSIQPSSRAVVDGVLNISQKGNHLEQWGVSDSENDAVIRSLSGNGQVQLGARRLVLTAAADRFDGTITNYDTTAGKTQEGGGLTIAGGHQWLNGQNDYTGLTEVSADAALFLAGSLASDVSVSGLLVVNGDVSGDITVEKGGTLAGSGTVEGNVTVAEGGRIAPMIAEDPNQEAAPLTINGNLVQKTGSVYAVQLAPDASDPIVIDGSATLEDGAILEVKRLGRSYRLLTAEEGVNGTYDSIVSDDAPITNFGLTYDPNNVFLE